MRKPEPLGTKFKVVCCSETDIVLWLEIQQGKLGMRDSEFQKQLGATAACVVGGIEKTKGCGQ